MNTIDLSIKIKNQKRTFGTDKEYIYFTSGGVHALLPKKQVARAMERAAKNKQLIEDQLYEKTFWSKFFKFFHFKGSK